MGTFLKATLTIARGKDLVMKDAVTFNNFTRRMVYELSNWSNSTTATDVCSPSPANRS